MDSTLWNHISGFGIFHPAFHSRIRWTVYMGLIAICLCICRITNYHLALRLPSKQCFTCSPSIISNISGVVDSTCISSINAGCYLSRIRLLQSNSTRLCGCPRVDIGIYIFWSTSRSYQVHIPQTNETECRNGHQHRFPHSSMYENWLSPRRGFEKQATWSNIKIVLPK